jgi:hypothetical protein
MDSAIVSALSAVLGTLVGGSATIATAWVSQRTQSRHESVSAEIRKREALYGKFIAECSRLAIDALDHALDDPDKVLQVHALLNRIRLTSSDAVVAAAGQTIRCILEQYSGPKRTREELQNHALSHADDPLKPFSEACRKELRALLHVT